MHAKSCSLRILKPTRLHTSSAAAAVSFAAMSQHPQSSVGADARHDEGDKRGTGSFRFWTDERRFKGPGSKCVVQEALFQAGGVRTGGYPKAAPIPGALGSERPSEWDLLWSPARLALKAIPNLKPGQMVSSCPGLMSITRKRRLSVTLFSALGEAAWQVMPQSFALPEELPLLCQYVEQQQQSGQKAEGNDELWILKTAQHMGKGLKLVTASQLVEEATSRSRPNKTGVTGTPAKPVVQAQRYIGNPLLIQGRKFGLRVWVLVSGWEPMRAYIHVNGLVLFSTDQYIEEEYDRPSGEVSLGHVTNYAQNVDGLVWNLEMLEQHLGKAKHRELWERISKNTAHVCAAALPAMRADNSLLQTPPESTFELLGFDYLVDENLHPWLLEVNGTPSLTVEHEDLVVEAIIHKQKADMARDMVHVINASTRFKARYDAMKFVGQAQRAAAAAASAEKSQAASTTGGDASDQDDDEENERGDAEGNRSSAALVGGLDAKDKDGGEQAGVMKVGKAKIALPRALFERLTPRRDAAVMERAQGELERAASCGFQQLNSRFPASAAECAGANGCAVLLGVKAKQQGAPVAGTSKAQIPLVYSSRDLALQQLVQQMGGKVAEQTV